MANGFGSLYVGASGLRGAQNSLNTTANNLSNVNTTGYVRQQVRYADMNYTKLKDSAANVNLQQSGLGVSIGDIVHARDIFLDKAYRLENGRKDFYSVRYETANYIEDLMQEIDGEQFKQSVTDLWTAFQELSTKPEISIYQNLTVQKAELFVSRSMGLYQNLQSYQANVNEQIRDDVNRVNQIGDTIYRLNLDIQRVEAGGVETAMTLRDQRDNLLDELGGYGRIEVTEDATGFTFVDFEGVQFIDMNRCNNIGLKEEKGTGFYTPYWPQASDVTRDQYQKVFRISQEFSPDNNTDVGSIKSKMIVRGDYYGYEDDLLTEEKYDKIANCTIVKTEAQLDHLFSTVIRKVNDVFCPNKEADVSMTGVDEQGNTVTINKGDLILDTENAPRGVDGKLPPRELFVRTGTERYKKVTVSEPQPDGTTKNVEVYLYQQEDDANRNTVYGIGSIHVNEDLLRQVTLMPAYIPNVPNNGVDLGFGAKLASLWSDQDMRIDPYDDKPCKIEEYYVRMVGALGTEGNTYLTVKETLEGTVDSVDAKRQQMTGVSSDEELTKMIKYQSAYNAASRFITVISQMTELIVTGLK